MFVRSVRNAVPSRPLPAVPPGLSVLESCAELARFDTDALAVMEGASLRGILCERDVIRKCLCAGRNPASTIVAEIMTPDPVTVAADRGLVEALRLMTDGGFRHLPVTEGGTVIALLSIQDIPAEYRMMAERFEEYRTTGG